MGVGRAMFYGQAFRDVAGRLPGEIEGRSVIAAASREARHGVQLHLVWMATDLPGVASEMMGLMEACWGRLRALARLDASGAGGEEGRS